MEDSKEQKMKTTGNGASHLGALSFSLSLAHIPSSFPLSP